MDEQDVPTPEHRRPEGVDDATVEALGKLSEALEAVEDARGHLYAFHRLTGTADLTLGEAVDQLREAGPRDSRTGLQHELVGRNVLEGRWTFQVVEEYDDGYYATFRSSSRGPRRAGRRATAPLRGRDEGGPPHPRPPGPRGRAARRERAGTLTPQQVVHSETTGSGWRWDRPIRDD